MNIRRDGSENSIFGAHSKLEPALPTSSLALSAAMIEKKLYHYLHQFHMPACLKTQAGRALRVLPISDGEETQWSPPVSYNHLCSGCENEDFGVLFFGLGSRTPKKPTHGKSLR